MLQTYLVYVFRRVCLCEEMKNSKRVLLFFQLSMNGMDHKAYTVFSVLPLFTCYHSS